MNAKDFLGRPIAVDWAVPKEVFKETKEEVKDEVKEELDEVKDEPESEDDEEEVKNEIKAEEDDESMDDEDDDDEDDEDDEDDDDDDEKEQKPKGIHKIYKSSIWFFYDYYFPRLDHSLSYLREVTIFFLLMVKVHNFERERERGGGEISILLSKFSGTIDKN